MSNNRSVFFVAALLLVASIQTSVPQDKISACIQAHAETALESGVRQSLNDNFDWHSLLSQASLYWKAASSEGAIDLAIAQEMAPDCKTAMAGMSGFVQTLYLKANEEHLPELGDEILNLGSFIYKNCELIDAEVHRSKQIFADNIDSVDAVLGH